MPRGGSRTGAGRKFGSVERKTALRIAAPLIQGTTAKEAVTAAAILASVDEAGCWRELILAEESRIRLDALKYLTDRRDGKAVEYLKKENVSAEAFKKMTNAELAAVLLKGDSDSRGLEGSKE